MSQATPQQPNPFAPNKDWAPTPIDWTVGLPASDERYRQALFHLLASQTSCFRYWGEGVWTDHGRKLSRRLGCILNKGWGAR